MKHIYGGGEARLSKGGRINFECEIPLYDALSKTLQYGISQNFFSCLLCVPGRNQYFTLGKT